MDDNDGDGKTEAEDGGALELANRGGVLLRGSPISWVPPFRMRASYGRTKWLQAGHGASEP